MEGLCSQVAKEGRGQPVTGLQAWCQCLTSVLDSGLLVHSLNKYLHGTQYIPGPGAQGLSLEQRDKNRCPHGAYMLVGETDNK